MCIVHFICTRIMQTELVTSSGFPMDCFGLKTTNLYTSLGETGFLREFLSGIDIRIMSQPEHVFQTPKLISRERGPEPSFLVRIHAQFSIR